MMKKIAIRAFLFFIFSFSMYAVMLYFWVKNDSEFLKSNFNYRRGSYGHMYSRVRDVRKTENVDILFLGSSHAYRGFDTRIYEKYGLKTFNLGSSLQTPAQTRVLLKRYLNQLNPKLIVYEVYPYTFCADGVESSLDIISNDDNDIYSLNLLIQKPHWKTANTLLYASIKESLEPHDTFKEPYKRSYDTYIPGGFVEKSAKYKKPIKSESNNVWVFNERQFDNFEKILKEIEQNKIPLILVQAPMSRKYYESYTNNSAFDKRMGEYGLYYNFNHVKELTVEKNFYDKDHLNQSGVELFNEEVIEILSTNKLLL